MTTLIDAAPRMVGHPDLAPNTTTDAGRLRSVGLGRSAVGDLLGGWLVQRAAFLATGTPEGSGLADLAIVDDPTLDDLADVAALRPGADHAVVWSLRPIPPADGWRERPTATLLSLPTEARAGTGPSVSATPNAFDTAGVARVTDRPGVLRLRSTLHGLGMNEPIGPDLLADARLRTWMAGHESTAGVLIAVVVGHLDVVAAVAGTDRAVAALLDVWRHDRSDLDGIAVLPQGQRWMRSDGSPCRTTPVHVAARTGPGLTLT